MDIYNNGKYRSRGADIVLTVHNGHAWPKDLHIPKSRKVHFYEGDVWQAQALSQPVRAAGRPHL